MLSINNKHLMDKNIINLANKSLTDAEKLVFSKGFKFSMTPKTVAKLDFISSIAKTENLPEEQQKEVCIISK